MNTQNGDIQRKPKGYCELKLLVEEFQRVANYFKSAKGREKISSNDPYIAAMFQENGSVQLLDGTSLSQFIKQGIPNGIETVSVFITPKGSKYDQEKNIKYCNFQTEYKIDKRACPQEHFWKLNVNQTITGGKKEASTIKSMSKIVNSKMKVICRMIVNKLESKMNCRVSHLVLDFVLDMNDDLWLVRTSECKISIEKSFVTKTALKKEQILHSRTETNDRLSANIRSKNTSMPYAKSQMDSLDGASKILGSTQLGQVCQGDFCGYEMETFMSGSAALNNYNENNLVPRDSEDDEVAVIRKRLLKIEHESQLKQIEEKWDEAIMRTKRGPSMTPSFDVTQSLVIQSRKCKDQIDMFLRHHRKGSKKAESILNDLWQGNSMGGSFPGHYYRSVKVCSNCFQVYELIKRKK